MGTETDGIVIGRISTARGDLPVYSPVLDTAEQIFSLLAGPAADAYRRLAEAGKVSVGERRARAALGAVLTQGGALASGEDIRVFLRAKLAEIGPEPAVPTRADLEASWKEILRGSGTAVRQVVGLLMRITAEEAGRIVPASQIPKIVTLVMDDFDVDQIRDWIASWRVADAVAVPSGTGSSAATVPAPPPASPPAASPPAGNLSVPSVGPVAVPA